MANSALSNFIRRNSDLALDFCVSASFVLALCFFFEPRWETNDDVGMSMVAHGYGIAAVGMPNFAFSNVIWGNLVRAIPQIHGVWGYSIATIGVWVTGYWLRGLQRWRFVQGAIVIFLVFNTAAVFSESRSSRLVAEQTRLNLQGFPNDAVVVWGGLFPYEDLYPVLRNVDAPLPYSLYALGVFTHAPFSVAYSQQASGGMIDRLTSQGGIPIVADEKRFNLLNIYCKERLGGVLNELAAHRYGEVVVSWRRCQSQVDQ